MTSYSVERPTLRPGRTRLAHLRPEQVTIGQPVTVHTLDADGREVESPAVFVRMARNHLHLCCVLEGEGNSRPFRPTQVFPRRVAYRRWTVTLQHKAATADGSGDELVPVFVTARTELEARYEALKQIKARHGVRSNWTYRLHSISREG